jgi:hypothetical protein
MVRLDYQMLSMLMSGKTMNKKEQEEEKEVSLSGYKAYKKRGLVK